MTAPSVYLVFVHEQTNVLVKPAITMQGIPIVPCAWPDSALIGTNAVIKSHDLVVLMLACEDFFKEQTGRDLEWPQHVNGILKTVGTLADFLEKA